MITALLFLLSLKALVADHYYRKASVLLLDREAGTGDRLAISLENMSLYAASRESLRTAIRLAPGHAEYYRAAADLDLRLGKWAEAMEQLGQPAPGVLSGQESFNNARSALMAAIHLEPANPDLHLALARVYQANGDDAALVDRELTTAVEAAPVNTAVRYAVALHYLLAGRKERAMEQAAVLARIDDSYKPLDEAEYKIFAQRKGPEYIRRMTKSFLFKAYEIAWRASDKNTDVIKKMTTASSDAVDVQTIFLNGKGRDETAYR